VTGIVRVGGRVYVDIDKFNEWLGAHVGVPAYVRTL
jgi:hypothetical protein